jgi:hypothetical protein
MSGDISQTLSSGKRLMSVAQMKGPARLGTGGAFQGAYNSGRLGAAALAGHGVTLTPQALSEGCRPESRPLKMGSGSR